MKSIAVLGSTGSIGCQTLDVLRAFPGEFSILGLSAWSSRDLLLRQAWEFRPQMLYCQNGVSPEELPPGCRLISDLREMVSAPEVELVMQGLVGNVGLVPTLEALQAGKQVALANKEPIVIAGELLMDQVSRSGVQLLPVDSEPSAIWQCLRGEDSDLGVRRLVITASGGPFRQKPLDTLAEVSPEEALQHPTWHMGPKITVDSATLMNKGFEVIEAHWLFDMPWDQVEVVVHPQSIIHSMVEFSDGSVKAQLGPPDMRLPIQYALFYPERLPNASLPRFDPIMAGALTFEPLDATRYPCFSLALEAGKRGDTYPAVLSAADEVAVEQFLQGRIGFLDIHRLVAQVLDRHQPTAHPAVEDILVADAWARNALRQEMAGVP